MRQDAADTNATRRTRRARPKVAVRPAMNVLGATAMISGLILAWAIMTTMQP